MRIACCAQGSALGIRLTIFVEAAAIVVVPEKVCAGAESAKLGLREVAGGR